MPAPIRKNPDYATGAHDAANAFVAENPDVFFCEANKNAIVNYMTENELPFDEYRSYKMAKDYLSAHGQLLIPSRQALAKMDSEELLAVAKKNGVPVFDGGRIVGYNWPKRWEKILDPVDDAPRYRQKSAMKHPEDHGKRPTKSEFAMWGPDRAREWAESNGSWGHELPPYLR